MSLRTAGGLSGGEAISDCRNLSLYPTPHTIFVITWPGLQLDADERGFRGWEVEESSGQRFDFTAFRSAR